MTSASRDYAVSLFELASETGEEAAFRTALAEVRTLFSENPDYIRLLSTPNIPKGERHTLIETAFADSLPTYVLSFLCLLCDRGDMHILFDCIREYEDLYNEFNRRIRARVVSAVELTADEKEKLVAGLSKKFARTIDPVYEVDEHLIGGVIVYADGKVIDGSLRHKLNEMKEELL
ncbi:MAG: ATP synthase F1 subunit delta [Clostridia bacterium]|nr:ATP synthase F1 subunit delta [Clostridia bacterium]